MLPATTGIRAALALLLAGLPAMPAVAQGGPDVPDVSLTETSRREIIDGVLTTIEASYVLPDVAHAMAAAVRDRDAHGEYGAIKSTQALADSLTSHLRLVSHDKHLTVLMGGGSPPPPTPIEENGAGDQAFMAEMFRHHNYGIDRVERLEGNVGYLGLQVFTPSIDGGLEDVLAAAMEFLSRTDALVIDLRENQGGEPEAVRLLASYFFGCEPVLLNSLYWRPTDRTDEYWTHADLDGPRYGLDRPVYVLTSDRTFSAAEEFAYDLQALGRSVVVGERTGGGAHPGDVEWVTDRVGVWVPTGRAINPVTGTNWEGVGVAPDLAVDESEALATAHLAALRSIVAVSTNPGHRQSVQRVIDRIASKD